MGFTPLEGLMMATRAGSVDPGLLLVLLREGLPLDELEDGLEHRSGLAGVSGVAGGDFREVSAAADAGDADARLALDVYAHRLRAGVAAMTAALDGRPDALVFTGGVGERSAWVRASAGVGVDLTRNEAAAGEDGIVSADGAPVAVMVVQAREDLEMAAQVRRALGG
jgi:acetate kinase